MSTRKERKKERIMSLPRECTVKINVDAFHIDQGKGATGAVARDCHGKFMIASCMEIHSVADPFMAETYVLRDGFSLAQHIGGNKFIIQSDNSKAN
jgi:hypothetical protein